MSKKLERVYHALMNLKLFDIIIYDFTDVSPFYDYQIIASASNERQAHSSIEFVKKALHKDEVYRFESDASNRWVLIDLKDVIVHVMHKETRKDYQIENLFFERKIVKIEDNNDGI